MSRAPEPFPTTPLSIRIPVVLKDRLESLASVGGNSLTQEVVQRLRSSCWPAGDGWVQRVLMRLTLDKVVRVDSESTSWDLDSILTLVDGLGVDRLVLAARPNAANWACLVVVMECSFTTLVLDGSWLNMARDQRIGEIEQLFQRLDARGLFKNALWCPQLTPETIRLPPEEALQAILASGTPAPLDLPAFLHLLSGHGCFDITRFQVPKPLG